MSLSKFRYQAWLWHARLGHLNFDDINKMTRKGLMEGIPRINHAGQICDACLLGKHSRTPFPNQAKFRSKNLLDLVYGDLCGPTSLATHSGKKLIFLLVDDCTRFMWAYFLTSKDQAFSTFKEFRQHIKMEMRMKLRMLRIDKGGEFTSNEFTKYCKENGIARQLTAPYSPQQNGAVERSNRTVVPTRALVDKTPYEALYNRKPNPKNLRIFGCTTYAKEHELIIDPDSPITPPAYTYNPNSEEEEEATISSLMNSENRFDDTPVRVARIEKVRLILALAAYHGWQVHHLDVKSAFLHGDLKEEVYVTQPEGFIQQGNSGKVYKLTKALYGLRQAPRAWNVKLDQTLKSLDFKKCNLEQAVYTKRSKTSTLIVGVYVDDLIITGTPRKEIDLFKSQMEDKFEMSDLGLLAYYLGIEVIQIGGVITIRQTGYINKILKETSMMESNDTKIPMDPGTKLVKAKDGNSVDATYYRSLIGSLRKRNYWNSILFWRIAYYVNQPTVALSSCKSEFMAATGAACQALWLKQLLSEITGWEEERITLKVDNISAIALVRNPVFHGRSKHIDFRYHFIRECIENGHINMEPISGELQRADILTKALPRLKFVTMRQMFGVQDLERSNDRD
uniref:Zinc finger, CCHC-type n=1 Tax=Tanacetum cinerariifolium TaxID=118510 RepID=A0A6L2N0J1_TANCI|nr:zinc finger, CCHC-type [Tanacetum cinerariifolium]